MKDLTEGSVTKHLLHMSAFMAVSMVVQTLYLLADLYWVGRLGKDVWLRARSANKHPGWKGIGEWGCPVSRFELDYGHSVSFSAFCRSL